MNNTNKTEYPALLAALQPGQAVNVLNGRIQTIHKINTDISAWLQERRKIEEQYVIALNNLASKRADVGPGLGVFQTPWQNLVAGTIALAEAHNNFASRIQADVESPLKDQRRDLQSMNSLQGNLAAMAKEVEKSRKKGASTQDNAASSSWESQAPYIFEQLQSLDENRVNQMREALTQLQTHEIDCHERSKSSAEASLNALLNVDTPEEVSAFVARTSAEIPSVNSNIEPALLEPSSRRGTGSRSGPESSFSSGLNPPGRSGPRAADDGRSEISDLSTETPKAEKKSRFGGLKRLGTVMSRRNNKDKEQLDSGKSPEKRGPRRNPLRRGSSAVMEPIPSPNPSTSELPATSTTRRNSGLEDSEIAAVNTAPTGAALANGQSLATHNQATADLARDLTAPAAPVTTNGSSLTANIPQIGIRPPSTIVEEGAAGSVLAEIERAQQEANSQERDNAFNLSIRDKPIQEESTDAQAAAAANVSNVLRASQMPPPQRRSGTLRGRRDVRNTMFVPNPAPEMIAAIESAPVSSASPVVGGITSPIVPSDQRAADTQSIRSAHSLASSVGPGAVKHADMTGPGLNASVVETSSATFSAGVVTKAVVIGELALIHNGPTSGSAQSSVRLDHFQVLEKVAPNPAFVTGLPDRSGEYTVDLSQLSRLGVAFKYQIHLSDTALASYAPITILAQYKIEPTQTSVILTYHRNPGFAPASGAPSAVILSNVVIVLNLEGTRALSCQSKPAGVFSKEKNLIYWRLGEVTLDDASERQQKLLARFATESEARTGSIEARWELSGAGSGLGVSLLGEGPGSNSGADPFADAGASSVSLAPAREIEVHRRLIAGRYVVS